MGAAAKSILAPIAAALFALALGAGPSARAQERMVDERADRVLRGMGEYLAGAREFSFRVRTVYDEVLEGGQKLQFEDAIEVAVRRPDRLRVDYHGAEFKERYWYDGKWFTRLDEDDLSYGRVSVPDTLDAALDHMARVYGVASPVADVVYADPYAVLIERVERGLYLGTARVKHERAHHLAFRQSNIDWQIWISEGHRPVPLKVVITYKNVPSAPQFTAYFSRWNFAPLLADSAFEFIPPEGAAEVELAPLQE